jgi:tetratricopeptide (TPR) repeat protein
MKYSLLFGCTVALVCFVDIATIKISTALNVSEIQDIARSTAVEINLKVDSKIKIPGSGVIVHRQGNLYTLVTNRHVVCGGKYCDQLPVVENYSITLADGQKYQIKQSAIKLLGNDLDLASIQFRSNHNYAVAAIASANSLKLDDQVYASGFPENLQEFAFGQGETVAVVNKRLFGDKGGYTIVYNAQTLPGMSGGGVFNNKGELVAIHGYGDRYTPGVESDDESKLNSKLGYNRGIPVRWLIQSLGQLNIKVGNRPLSEIQVARKEAPKIADEYFIAGFNQIVEPGNNVLASKRQAVKEISKAIQLNPKYATAYHIRGVAYRQLKKFPAALQDFKQVIAFKPNFYGAYMNMGAVQFQLDDYPAALSSFDKAIALAPDYDETYNNRGLVKLFMGNFPGALKDFDMGIKLNPKNAFTYNNRGLLKGDKLKDFQGALADFTAAIAINENFFTAYNNRGELKANHLNDLAGALADYTKSLSINSGQPRIYALRGEVKEDLNDLNGAIADYNQAILLNPQAAVAYYNRGLLKMSRLNDLPGALTDFNQAIRINPKDTKYFNNRGVAKYQLGDYNGALADYSQAIALDPKNAEPYGNRGLLKINHRNDRAGGIADLRQAAKLFRAQKEIKKAQVVIDLLRELGVTE